MAPFSPPISVLVLTGLQHLTAYCCQGGVLMFLKRVSLVSRKCGKVAETQMNMEFSEKPEHKVFAQSRFVTLKMMKGDCVTKEEKTSSKGQT